MKEGKYVMGKEGIERKGKGGKDERSAGKEGNKRKE